MNSAHSVDIEFYSNGEADVLTNVPVKHYKTSSAFFVLKLKKGDKGVIRFFDDDVELWRDLHDALLGRIGVGIANYHLNARIVIAQLGATLVDVATDNALGLLEIGRVGLQ